MIFTNKLWNSVTVEATKGGGDDQLLIARRGSAVSDMPWDDVEYSVGDSVGLEGIVVGKYSDNSNSSTYNVTGLLGGEYHFRTVEFMKADLAGGRKIRKYVTAENSINVDSETLPLKPFEDIKVNFYQYSGQEVTVQPFWENIIYTTVTSAGTWASDLKDASGEDTGIAVVGLEAVPFLRGGEFVGDDGVFHFSPHNVPDDALRFAICADSGDATPYLQWKLTGLRSSMKYDIHVFCSNTDYGAYDQSIEVECVGGNTVTDDIADAYENQSDVVSCLNVEPDVSDEIQITVSSRDASAPYIVSVVAFLISEHS